MGHGGDFLNLYPQAEICCLGGGVALRFVFIVFINGESCYLCFFKEFDCCETAKISHACSLRIDIDRYALVGRFSPAFNFIDNFA